MFTRFSIYLRPKLFVVNIDLCWCIYLHSDVRIVLSHSEP